MKTVESNCLWVGMAMILLCAQPALAQQGVALESCRQVLAAPGDASPGQTSYCEGRTANARSYLEGSGIGSSGSSNIEVIERADLEYDMRRVNAPKGSDAQSITDKRADLRAWGVDVQALPDAQVRDRWNREFDARMLADLQAERRRQEADKLGTLARDDASAEQSRQRDEIARQAATSAEGMRRAAEMARTQGDAALRSFGVNPEVLNGEDEEAADAEVDAFGLRLYQQMVDNGLAPECKGKTGAALIDCVDKALGTDE
jgi:hypothetical protein